MIIYYNPLNKIGIHELKLMKERKKKKQKGRRKERKEERGKKVLSYAKVLTSINRRNDKIRKSLFDKYDNN